MKCNNLYILLLFYFLTACNTDCPIQSEQSAVVRSLQGTWQLDSVLTDNTKSNLNGTLIVKNDSLQYLIGNSAESLDFVVFKYNSQIKTLEFQLNIFKQVKEIKSANDKSLVLKDAFSNSFEYFSKVK